MNQKFNRLIAYPALISDIYKYEFKKGEGDWDPNYLDFDYKKVSRTVVAGTVVDTRIEESNTITIDDGTGTIDVREFVDESKKKKLFISQKVGDLILVIGRIREFNSQRYIMPEIVKAIDAISFKYNLLKAKIDNQKHAKDEIRISAPLVAQEKVEEKPIEKKEEEIVEDAIEGKPIGQIINKTDIVLKIISEEDKGDGVEIVEIIEKSMLDDCEKIVNDLLASGDLFMVKPGRVKVL
ncbi:MAG: hypothetical protein KAT43_01785 [Nanoarchaeota archaeon]|nr:hypothetical protein [Nanoarchaeota archaeon]